MSSLSDIRQNMRAFKRERGNSRDRAKLLARHDDDDKGVVIEAR